VLGIALYDAVYSLNCSDEIQMNFWASPRPGDRYRQVGLWKVNDGSRMLGNPGPNPHSDLNVAKQKRSRKPCFWAQIEGSIREIF
jgi:hypothetical protein